MVVGAFVRTGGGGGRCVCWCGVVAAVGGGVRAERQAQLKPATVTNAKGSTNEQYLVTQLSHMSDSLAVILR